MTTHTVTLAQRLNREVEQSIERQTLGEFAANGPE